MLERGYVRKSQHTLTLPVRIVMQPSWVRVTELGSGRSGMALSRVSAKDATVRCRASYDLRCLSYAELMSSGSSPLHTCGFQRKWAHTVNTVNTGELQQ